MDLLGMAVGMSDKFSLFIMQAICIVKFKGVALTEEAKCRE